MKKFSCSTLAVLMRCIENAGFWDRLFLSAIVNSDRVLGMRRPYRALPKPKKPGFFEPLYLDTDILAKTRFLNRALPKSKKPGFFEPLCLDTDILAKTRFLTRARSRVGGWEFLGRGRIVFWGVFGGRRDHFWGVFGGGPYRCLGDGGSAIVGRGGGFWGEA